MSGETNLRKLLQSMQPILCAEEYVFCSVNQADDCQASQRDRYFHLDPIGQFKENEGTTLILKREQADEVNLSYTSVFSLITLSVHSSLDAVGFLAAITNKLAEHNISVNPVSAYYHDHLFVPAAHTEKVMMLLQEFSQ